MRFEQMRSRQTIFVAVFLALAVCSSSRPMAVSAQDAQSDAKPIEIGDQIAKNWSCGAENEQLDIEVKFRVTPDGNPFDIELLKGFENPRGIRATIHSIIFAAAYKLSEETDSKNQAIRCTVIGASQKPKIEVALVDGGETKPTAEEALKAFPKDEAKVVSSMFAWPIDGMLTELCALLYKFPDSKEVKKELDSLCDVVHISPADQQTWLAIGRSRTKVITIQRNPPPRALKYAQASAAAFAEAARIRRSKPTLYELEEAYLRIAAINVLQASKADPVLLASAAVLTYQLQTAKEEYGEATKYGDTRAKQLFDQMVSKQSSAQVSKVDEKQLPQRTTEGWEKSLYWLPEDTELVVVNHPSSVPSAKKQTSLARGIMTPEELQHMQFMLKSKNNWQENDKLFINSKVAFALHAARRFEYPKGLGAGSSDSADILVFEDASKSLSKLVMERIRPFQTSTQTIEGTNVLAFDSMPFTFGRFSVGPNPQLAQFVCSPIEGVIISTNKIDFLREILSRLSEAPSERAIPANLPEWKQVDVSARSWGIRHYNRANVPFDNAGLYSMGFASGNPTMSAKDDAKGETNESETKTADEGASYVKAEKSTAPGRKPDPRLAEAEELRKILKVAETQPDASINKEIGFCYYITNDNKLVMKSLSLNEATLKLQQFNWSRLFDYNSWKPNQQVAPQARKGKSSIVDNVLTVEGPIEEPSLAMLTLITNLGYFIAI